MKAILFPGQGSQVVGMGLEFYNNFEIVKKIFKEIGTLEPSKDKIPSENAMSVADGIAQPFNVSVLPKFIKT